MVESPSENTSGELMKARASLISIMLILAVSVWAGLTALQAIRGYSEYPPDFDEAAHLLPALQIANDVRSLRVADFWVHTYTQDQIAAYPFLHSWLLAPFFLLWKPAIVVGRASGLVFLGAAAIVGFLIGRELSSRDRWPWMSGLVSALLILSSLPLWVYASVAYLEAAGLLVTLVGLLCYVKAGPDENRPRWLVAASVAAACALFTKYSFGVFIVGSIFLSETLSALATRRLPSRSRLIYLAGPGALLTLIWFADPNKLYRFWIYSQSQKDQVEFWSAANLLYYPISLIRYYASGPLSIALILVGLAMSLFAWRQHGFRSLAVYLLLSTFALTVVPQHTIRFMYTVAPVAFILASPPAGRFIAWIIGPPQKRWLQAALGLLVAGLLMVEGNAIAQRLSFYSPALEVTYLSSPDTRQMYRFLANNTLARGVRPHILNFWHLVNNYALEWEYYADAGGDPAACDFRIATVSLAPEPTEANLRALTQMLRQRGASALVSIDGSPAGSYTGWQVVEPLLVRGELEAHPDHPYYTLIEWPSAYAYKVFAGDFSTREELEQARRKNKVEFPIQIHLYFLKP